MEQFKVLLGCIYIKKCYMKTTFIKFIVFMISMFMGSFCYSQPNIQLEVTYGGNLNDAFGESSTLYIGNNEFISACTSESFGGMISNPKGDADIWVKKHSGITGDLIWE